MTKKVFIEGMSCGHCVRHVTEALKELQGVTDVNVNLEQKFAVVNTKNNVTDEDIKSAIDDAGYEVVKIEI